MDRMVMSVAIPYIAVDFNLRPVSMGLLLSAFFASYSIAQIPGGILADRFGTRRVSAFSMLWWSVFTALTGVTTNFAQMIGTRFLFGLGEGLYPACVFKAIAIWFPKGERATANGIRFAAGPLGTALSPLFVVAIMGTWGWRSVFYWLFLPGILVTFLVWRFLRDNPAELTGNKLADGTVSRSEHGPSALTWREVIRDSRVIKYFLALFLFDIAYWGFTTWLPTYLVKSRGFSLQQMGVAASLPFFAGTLACIAGGWASDRFFSQSRTLPILVTQIVSAALLYCMAHATSVGVLVICQTLAGFTLNLFFTAFWALPMNTIPKEVMGVASGLINMAGQIAAFISPICVGALVQASGGSFGSTFAFLIASIASSAAVILMLQRRLA